MAGAAPKAPVIEALPAIGAQIEARALASRRRGSRLPDPARARVDLPPVPRRVRAHRALPAAAARADRRTAARPRRDAAREPSRAARALRRLRLRGPLALRRQHGPARRHAGGRREPVAARACWSSTSGCCPRSSACRNASRTSRPRTCSCCAPPASADLGARDFLGRVASEVAPAGQVARCAGP